MKTNLDKEKAYNLLKEYNKESFHILHGFTVAGIMKYFAFNLGYESDSEFWELCGLLHDVDYEKYPDEHCVKAVNILQEAGAGDELIHTVCSHGYGICSDVKPEHEMEKVLFAVDELSGLIFAAAKMRPSKSVMDMEVKSVKKKFKDKSFAAGCSRDIIKQGAEMLGWDLNKLFEMTLDAMRSCETEINEIISNL